MGKIGEGAWSTLNRLSNLKRPHSENDDPIDALAEAVATELEDTVAVAETSPEDDALAEAVAPELEDEVAVVLALAGTCSL